MKHLDSFAITVSIYVLVSVIGLWISYTGPSGSEGLIDTVKEGKELPPVVEDPEDTSSSFQIILYVLVSTALIMLLLKYRLDMLIKFLIYIGLFSGVSLTLWKLFGFAGVVLAVPLMLAAVFRNNLATTNIMLIFALSGIGSWIGASLSLLPSLLLLVGLAVYDFIAVYGTKHMVTLAENTKGRMPLMFAIPVGDRVLGLGTGDLAVPLVFSVSVLRDVDLLHALTASLGGLAGLAAVFFYVLRKKEVALPALPPIAAGLLVGYGLGMLF